MFSFLTGISEGVPCNKGEYFDNGSCEPCPTGTHMDEEAHLNADCEACSEGHYADEEGQSSCKPCLPGTYEPSIGASECQLSHPGKFSPNNGSISEQECPPGTYSGWGAAVCLDCQSGFYCPGDSDHIPCPNGTNSMERATTCLPSGTGLLLCPRCWRKEKFPGYEDCLKNGECEPDLATLNYER